jgi:hypothetical protein
MGFLQQFQLVIKYKKGTHNKVKDMLSRLVVNASTILKYNSLAHESYVEQYARDDDFKDVYEALNRGNEKLDYHMHGKLLYHLGNICIPMDETKNVTREAHRSLTSFRFSVGKTIGAQLQIYCYWPRMNDTISRYIKGCVMCSTSNPSNMNFRLYTPLLVPYHPWESVSMDFLGGFTMSKTGHDYLYVMVDMFSKMCILIPCKK